MTRSWWWYAILAVVPLCWASPGRAVVTDSSEAGFTVQLEVTLAAVPDKAYRQATNAIGKWWGSEHTFSGDAANMYIENRAGGCFCERLQGGGSVQHMRVVFADPGKTLRMTGGLGPLQTMAVNGSMSWEFAAVESHTKLTVVYTVGGYLPGGLSSLAGPVNGVLSEQLSRLKRFLETGRPDTAK